MCPDFWKLTDTTKSLKHEAYWFYLFGVLRRFQHCTGHIMTGSWKGRGNHQFVRVLYCKLPTNGKQLPAFPLEAVLGIEPRPQRWEARVLPLCHRGPYEACWTTMNQDKLNILSLICSSWSQHRTVWFGIRQVTNRGGWKMLIVKQLNTTFRRLTGVELYRKLVCIVKLFCYLQPHWP